MSETRIHPTAVIDSGAELDESVRVGPHAVIEAGVRIGAGTVIGPCVHIQGTTEIGEDNQILTGAVIGLPPQYTGFDGRATSTVIGSRNIIREYVSIHRPIHDGAETRIGDGCFLMGLSHVAHDCTLADGVILANGAMLAGHVEVGEKAFVSGNVAVHQFCRVGRLAMLGGGAMVSLDVPPFVIAEGNRARIRGFNVVGMRRAGVEPAARSELKRLLRAIHDPGRTVSENLAELTAQTPEGQEFLAFHRTGKRGVCALGSKTDKAEDVADSS